MHNLKNQDPKKPCIVAGNGPSLAAIDYARLPKDFDVFRCNQFYFEDKYYLGKEIKLAFANPGVLFEQLYTLRTLHYRGEYDIDGIVCTNFNLDHIDYGYKERKMRFGGVMEGQEILDNLGRFRDFLHYNELFLSRRITSGIYMCAVAVALGYKQIYIAGIDFYEGDRPYAFEFLKKNLLRLSPDFSPDGQPYGGHGKDVDLEGLEFLAKHYGVEFYSLCPSSPLSKHLPLASPTGGGMRPESRSADSIQDLLIPSKQAYEKFNRGLPDNFMLRPPGEEERRLYESYKAGLKHNGIQKVARDLLRLPRDLASYIKGRRLLAKWKKEWGSYE